MTDARARTNGSAATPDADERLIIGAALRAGKMHDLARTVSPADFADPRLARVWVHLLARERAGLPLDLANVGDSLRDAGELAALGGDRLGLVLLADCYDQAVPEGPLLDFEVSTELAAMQRRRRASAVQGLVDELTDPAASSDEIREALQRALARLDAEGRKGTATPAASLEDLGFSGGRLLSLLERPKPAAVEAGRPTPGNLTLLVAPPFTGKSSLAYWNAMARAAGVAPWRGSAVRSPGRVLLFSVDEAPEQVARRMRGLAALHPAGELARYADRLLVIGPDREIDPDALDGLRFDDVGLARLAEAMRISAREERPFEEVYIDAYADLLPIGAAENSNEEATRIGGALQRLAVETGAAITLLHHAGKPPKQAEGEIDVLQLSRGASALAAKARIIISLELVPGLSNLRRIRTKTNLGPAPGPALFAVSDQGAAEGLGERIDFLRPHDVLGEHHLETLILEGEEVSTSELARRIAGCDEGQEPTGDVKRLASQLRERWRKAGRVEVFDGKRNAKMIRRTEARA